MSENPHHALRSIAGTLTHLGQPFALVGGLAVSIRAEVRFTRDVDLAIATDSDSDTEQLIQLLRLERYEIAAIVEQDVAKRLATVRLVSPSGIVVDLLAASCGIEPEIVGRANSIAIGDISVSVARAEELLAMKILSFTNRRRQDFVDAIGLLECNPSLDLSSVRHNLQLIEDRGFARQQHLGSKLDLLLAEWRQQ